MNKNEISAKQLNTDAQNWIEKLRQALLIQDKGKGTVKNYTAEMILLFKYHNNKTVAAITQADIELYIVYIKTVHKVGRAKCRSVASACAYFYKQVIKMPYILPSALYPQKQFILPNIMSQQQVTQLFAAPLTLKEYCVIGLLWQWFTHKRSSCIMHTRHRQPCQTHKSSTRQRRQRQVYFISR